MLAVSDLEIQRGVATPQIIRRAEIIRRRRRTKIGGHVVVTRVAAFAAQADGPPRSAPQVAIELCVNGTAPRKVLTRYDARAGRVLGCIERIRVDAGARVAQTLA